MLNILSSVFDAVSVLRLQYCESDLHRYLPALSKRTTRTLVLQFHPVATAFLGAIQRGVGRPLA
jgi:hypothetical protein